MKEIDHLVEGGVRQGFAAAAQRFGEPDGGVLHAFVSVVGPADEEEAIIEDHLTETKSD